MGFLGLMKSFSNYHYYDRFGAKKKGMENPFFDPYLRGKRKRTARPGVNGFKLIPYLEP
jgi:hypothetical protein